MGKPGQDNRRVREVGGLFLALLALGLMALNSRTWSHGVAGPASLETAHTIQSRTSHSDSHGVRYSSQPIGTRVLTGNLPLSFEPNRGQTDNRVRFLSSVPGYNVFLTATEAVFSLRIPPAAKDDASGASARNKRARERVSVVRMTLKGSNPQVLARGTDELPGVKNYLIGSNSSRWQTAVPTYRKVRYEQIYPGIDLSYYGTQRQLEYDFEVAPGADPGLIRLECTGAKALRIDAEGDLVMQVKDGELRQHRPVIYQEMNGQRAPIDGHFVIRRGREIGFEIGDYDKSRPLVIDPTLVYSTYLGAAGVDSGSSIDIDNGGNIYVAGTTSSTTFPMQNALRSSNAGLEDVFVTKLDPTGGTILYSTYVGGSSNDRADGIFVDRNSGAAYVVGRVDAGSFDFPTTPGAFATTYRGGDFDAFVLKLNSAGNSLAYSSFLGGQENDSAVGVVADSGGNAYVTGGTRSTGFPATPNAYQPFVAGDTDAYLVKVNPAGSSLLYATLLGGGATDRGSSVRIDSSGIVYLVGYTSSSDFPTQNAFQNSLAGSFDAFVARIDPTQSGGNSLVLCSYLGGIADDKGYGLALDPGNNIYIAGQTSSINFPVLNPAQAARGGNFDAFIAKISSVGVKTYATYLGGGGDDRATAVVVNPAGEAYVTGFTASPNFPTVIPLQISNGGGIDAFVTKINGAGNGILYSTYLGGSANDNYANTTTFSGNIALDGNANAYVTGFTASTNFPTASPLQSANAGGASDAFIARIADGNPLDDPQFFVRQHYLDFLHREPDPGGLAYWTNEISKCGNVACVNDRRISVSAAFFFSDEFQQSGGFVYRLYRGTLGRDPTFAEFSADRSKLIGGPNLPANKEALAREFITRLEFVNKYPAAEFIGPLVDTAKNSSGAPLAALENYLRQDYSNCTGSNSPEICKARVVQLIADYPELAQAVFNRSFVLMEYFGYLRRDADPGGYAFWLNVLNNLEPNNYRGMVCAFITSAEYQLRFSPVVTRTNAECAGVH